MERSEKQQTIEDLNRVFRENRGVFVFGFSGISVPEITELRHRIRQGGSRYRVVKNRLAKLAARETSLDQMSGHFSGPTAVAYTDEDVVALAKAVKEFAKEHPGFQFKGGVLNETALSAEEIRQLADLPSREELLAKLAYLLQAPASRLAGALQAPLRDMASLLKQIAEAKQES